MKKSSWWRLCKIMVLLLLIVTFTPLITPAGVHKPSLGGLPYTLWAGMIHAILLVGITWIGTRVHPGRKE